MKSESADMLAQEAEEWTDLCSRRMRLCAECSDLIADRPQLFERAADGERCDAVGCEVTS